MSKMTLEKLLEDGLTIKTKLNQITVNLEVEEGIGDDVKKVTKPYVLREFLGPDRDAWAEHQVKSSTPSGDGNVRITKWTNYYQTLIQKCLFDAENKQLTIEQINKLIPGERQQVLFEACCILNGLENKDNEDDEGND